MSDIFAKLQEETAKQKQLVEAEPSKPEKQSPTRKSTQKVTQSRGRIRETSSNNSRENPREFPNRDEIQEFSFRLRDALKVKVQAEVPHEWQDELEALARNLNVKKLELYRYIIGEFLGKVEQKKRVE